jgi:aminopeptidase YwaD
MFKRLAILSCLLSTAAFAADISPQRYLDNIKYLSSDELKGRGNDMPELQKAARYVAAQFTACGLQPVNGSYFQKYSATVGIEAGSENKLSGYVNGVDFQVLGVSDSGKFSGSVAFAGYGISWAPHYDDYAGLDATGKVVLVLRGAPQDSKEFADKTRFVEKALTAKAHGAVALLVVNKASDDPFLSFQADAVIEHLGIPVLQVKRAVAEKLLGPAKLDDLQAAIDKDFSNHSRALTARLEGQTDIIRRTREIENVTAMLPGDDPQLKSEVIAFGAHYDHLGLGGRDSLAPDKTGQIHHGADDNASGTAGLIELGCAMHDVKHRRSLLFLAFSGEELGLFGSAAYVKSPLIPLEKTEVMLNMDMIGRVKDHKLFIGDVGTAAEFQGILEEEAKSGNLKIEYSKTGTDSSDHLSFALKQVPSLFFFSGLHADYHKPSDTWDKIDAQSAADVLRLVERVALHLDQLAVRPKFVRVEEPPRPVGGGGGGYGPWFGSIPDMGDSENGVKFADVRAGSPAEKAGLKPGDVMVAWNGREIKNLYDFTHELQNSKVGDKVTVTVMRNGTKVNAEVVLATRP